MNSILKKSLSAIMVFCLMFLCLGLSVRVNAVTNNYVKYTDELVDGEYIIYYEGKAMNTTVTSSRLQYIEITPVSDTISTADASIIWQISKNGDYWTIYNSAVNKYAAGTGVNNRAQMLASNEEDYSLWSLTYNSKNGTYDFINKGNAAAGLNKTLRNNGTYGFACYSTSTGGSLSLYKLSNEAVEPAIAINVNASYTKVGGEKLDFSYETVGIDNPDVSWKSSNPDVATIENGTLNPKTMGTTTISASVADIISNEIEIKVYPDNTNPITVEEALEVCEMTGTTQTDWQYSVDGTVSNVNGNYVTISDGTGDITAFKLKNVIQGERVLVSGFLVNYYNDNTSEYVPEFTSGCTALKYFSVTFDSNGGSTVSPLGEVLEGTTISTPTEPTNEGYSLVGWYNGNSQWNFATDTVTSNITLTAKWVLSNLETVFADLNNVDAYMSMAYSYNINGEIKTDELNRAFTGVSGSSYTAWSEKTSNSTAVYAGQSAGGNESIQLRATSPSGIITTTSGGYARKITVQWNSNTTASRTLDIYGSNTEYTSASDLYGDSKGTKLGSIVFETSTELVIEGDYQYIGIRSNSGTLYLDSISIEWSTVVITEMYSNMEFRLGAGIDKDIADLASQLDNAKYGIEVSDGEKTEKYYSSDSLFKNNLDNDIFYVVISLGDIFNNKERVDVEFTVKAFIEYDGDTYYSSLSKTYSVKTLVEKYLSDDATKEAVQPLKEALENLGYTFE